MSLGGEEKISDDKVENADPGRPVSAAWSRKDGSSGRINFDYLVDASGRAGIISTKYLKNRTFNQDLKNVANWGYWKGAISYGVGTPKQGDPFFEALSDGSGWAWFIPLHNGTTSVGVVMNQAMSTEKKRAAAELNGKEYYLQCIQDARGVAHLLSQAELSTDIKYASDWSYSASSYASPYCRIVGDAGSFIDPYFSSGVHLALSGGLSAATTICASIKGQADEKTCFEWHSKGVAERYTRFLLVVMGATKQIRSKEQHVLSNEEDEGFDDAFSVIRPGKYIPHRERRILLTKSPVIQGRADVRDGATNEVDIQKAVDFTSKAVGPKEEFTSNNTDIEGINSTKQNLHGQNWEDIKEKSFSAEEAKVMKMVKNVFKDYFQADTYAGKIAKLEHGNLGLVDLQQKQEQQQQPPTTNGVNGHAEEESQLKPLANGHPEPIAV